MPEPTTTTSLGLDIEACDREPIHVPGAIQPHGALVACDLDGRVVAVSENVADLLDAPAGALLGNEIGLAFGLDCAAIIEQVRDRRHIGPHAARTILARGYEVTAMPHLSADSHIVIELAREPAMLADVAQLYSQCHEHVIAPVGAANTRDQVMEAVVDGLRTVLGCTRVLAYRFLPDWSGEVIAESAEQHRFLHHRFPASDIPAQARRLYTRNVVRLIPQASYEPVPIIGRTEADVELDLSLSWLRSVSPVHLQYLHNMGVDGSICLSLLIGGQLWGMIAAHHSTPLSIPFAFRQNLELMGQTIALRIEALAAAELLETRTLATSATVQDALRAAASPDAPPGPNALRTLAALIDCQGFAVLRNGDVTRHGAAPPDDVVRAIADQRRDAGEPFPFSSERNASPDGDGPVGFLASEVFSGHGQTQAGPVLFWFREEHAREIRWAGEPLKVFDHLDRLSPRTSFDTWVETTSGACRPWTDRDLTLASELGKVAVA